MLSRTPFQKYRWKMHTSSGGAWCILDSYEYRTRVHRKTFGWLAKWLLLERWMLFRARLAHTLATPTTNRKRPTKKKKGSTPDERRRFQKGRNAITPSQLSSTHYFNLINKKKKKRLTSKRAVNAAATVRTGTVTDAVLNSTHVGPSVCIWRGCYVPCFYSFDGVSSMRLTIQYTAHTKHNTG